MAPKIVETVETVEKSLNTFSFSQTAFSNSVETVVQAFFIQSIRFKKKSNCHFFIVNYVHTYVYLFIFQNIDISLSFISLINVFFFEILSFKIELMQFH